MPLASPIRTLAVAAADGGRLAPGFRLREAPGMLLGCAGPT
ncbi:MAG TPA: hypothetical protein VMR62_18510 [Bryobacteraceae bacterium]|nr:hypothetical protein [Bryobacteraceae bacterium]